MTPHIRPRKTTAHPRQTNHDRSRGRLVYRPRIARKFSRLDGAAGWFMRITILCLVLAGRATEHKVCAPEAERHARLRNSAYRFLAPLFLLAASVVAAASDANAPREYLDAETGATVFFVGRPLVFAHEHSAFGGDVPRSSPITPGMTAAPRDYVTLAAAAVDRNGRYTYMLIGYFWSVGAPPQGENACAGREHLVLQLGDRRIELPPFAGSARDAGISQQIHRPSTDAKPAVYPSDLATLTLLGESAHPVLYCGAEKAPLKYELLEDRLPALRELVRHLSD